MTSGAARDSQRTSSDIVIAVVAMIVVDIRQTAIVTVTADQLIRLLERNA